MKQCSYCGKEYPDDATVCPMDRQPLVSDVEPSPSPERLVIDMQAHFAARPLQVKVAAGLLGEGLAFDTIKALLRIAVHHPSPSLYPAFYFNIAVTYVVTWILLYFVFRGKNWARWLVLCSIVLGILSPLFPHYRVNLGFYLYSLLDIVAVFLLFQRPSGEWFTKSKYLSENSQPAS
jgi:hypothetical protein